MRRSSAAILAAAALGLLPGGALAASATIHASPNPVHAGKKVRVFGNAGGCPVGDRVTLLSRAFSHRHEFAGVPAVFATVNADGHYSKRTRIPASRTPKKYKITARCGGGTFGVVRKLRVLAP
jgi:hypothetical protein